MAAVEEYRIRINEIDKPIQAYKRNDLYRQFSPVFNTIFSSESLAVEFNNGDAGYVPDKSIEDAIRGFSNTPINHLNLIIGETGIGKSTYIKKVFSAGLNPTIMETVLYIPFFLNGKVITDENYKDVFIRQIRAAYKLCKRTYPDLAKFDHQKIYDFIDEHNSALLEVDEFFDDSTPQDLLSALARSSPYAFFAEMLKYAADNSPIKKVIVIIDDLEAIDDAKVQHKFVHQACRFHKCLKNVGNRNFCGETVISLRPFTNKLLKNTSWFSAYTPNTILNISKPARLAQIFLARFDYVLTQGHEHLYAEKERFEEAKDVLEKVFYRFDGSHLSHISKLCNYNIRDSITLVGEIISNRRFIQGNKPVQEQFKINNSQFVFNDGNIVKSMAFDQNDVFLDHRPSVFNILKNGPAPDTDLVLAYICKYFYSKSSGEWENMEYVEFDQFSRDISILLSDEKYLSYCVKYLKDEGVLECESLHKSGQEKIYIFGKPKLFGIFDLLRENSVLIDAFRDDTYTDSDYLNVGGSIEPINRIKSSSAKAVATLGFWRSVMEGENRLIMRVRPQETKDFKRKFGDVLLSRMIATGVKNTLSSNESHYIDLYTKHNSRLKKIEGLY